MSNQEICLNLTPPPGTVFTYHMREGLVYVRAEDQARGIVGFGYGFTAEQAHQMALVEMQARVDTAEQFVVQS